ncbi:MAG: NosD domain-containing protein [Candidatus Thermoplasmatota archaeon]|nr:NosD domain-containing protein [Candidatus Thermoplasmatota archaeon]
MNKFVCLVVPLLVIQCCLQVTGMSSMDADGSTGMEIAGRIIFVNASGGGDYTHIQWAIDNASDGDAIFVEAGTYRENLIINKTINLTGLGWDDTIIDGGRKGDTVYITADWVNVSGFNIRNSGNVWNDAGIDLYGVHHNRIERNLFVNNQRRAIYLESNSYANRISNNTCSDNDQYTIVLVGSYNNFINDNNCSGNDKGIWLYSSNGNEISNNTCENNSQGGIYVRSSNENLISNNLCINGREGISIIDSEANIINANNCSNQQIGISLDGSVRNNLTDNEMIKGGIYLEGNSLEEWGTNEIDDSNMVNGKPFFFYYNISNKVISPGAGQIIFVDCHGMKVVDQDINNVSTGLLLVSSTNITVANNQFTSNSLHGIEIWDSFGINISQNMFISNDYTGIYLDSSSEIAVVNNQFISNSIYGIEIWDSYGNVISNNSFILNYYVGIFFKRSNDNIIMGNTCRYNGYYAIHFDRSNRNTISNNMVTENHYSGIYFVYSEYNVISNNLCTNNSNGIDLVHSDFNTLSDNFCNSNTINGINIRYSDRITISANICRSNQQNGNYIYVTRSSSISKNICSNNFGEGMILYNSLNCSVSENTYAYNKGNGLSLQSCRKNSIYQNTFEANLKHGICLSYYNDNCDYNTIMNNTIISNDYYGVVTNTGTQDNSIFRNRLYFNNGGTNQALDNGTRNDWSSSDEGNYWSDWITPDSNMDGIVDIPYNIKGTTNTKDFFPLTNPARVPVPKADAGYDIIVNQHEEVIFSASGCKNPSYITNYTWSFTYQGHKQYIYGSDTNYIFDIAGIYEVSLHVNNKYNHGSSDTLSITVKDITPPFACAGEDVFINQHDTVTLNGTKSQDNIGITIHKWNFIYEGIFRTFLGSSQVFKFNIAGIYPVILEVADAEGNWGTDIININVRDITDPIANAGENQTVIQHDSILLNGALSWDNIEITNFTWSFVYAENDLTFYGKTTSFAFNIIGHYSIRLTVSDKSGNRDVDFVNITVLDATPPHANAGKNVFIDEGCLLVFDGSNSWDNVEIKE